MRRAWAIAVLAVLIVGCVVASEPTDEGVQTPMCSQTEQCNQIDDDCDGSIDEDFLIGQLCELMVNGCVVVGSRVCDPSNSLATLCLSEPDSMPPPEVCNDMDDDCDGSVDEGLSGCNMMACVPEPEQCNELDDDCDGLVDETLINDCGVCGELPEELCNAQDDDCDGRFDEGADCPCPTAAFMGRNYQFCEAQVSWSSAREECARTGYELIIINTAEEDDFLYQTIDGFGFEDTWIGLTDTVEEGRFEWVDGSVPGFLDWDEGEPNDGGGGEDCGIMLMASGRESRWDDRPCDRNYSSVCEIP